MMELAIGVVVAGSLVACGMIFAGLAIGAGLERVSNGLYYVGSSITRKRE